MDLPMPRWLSATLTSAALVAAATGVIALLDPRVPAVGLGVLYLFAVVPIGLAYGLAAAGAVSVASMVALDYFFLAPTGNLNPETTEHWVVLVAFLGSSLVISELAARSQREARRSARLAEEQAALRRVATLVARAVPRREVFAAVAREVGQLLDAHATYMGRYEPDGTATGVASWSSTGDSLPIGRRLELDGENVAGLVQRTGRPARLRYQRATGPRAAVGQALGLRSAVGAPIVVDQRLWGVMIAASKGDTELAADAEPRIAAFTELLATAIANAESRTALARLADEQAALRRVATLVARGAPPEELFAAVVEEVGRVLPVQNVGMGRYESDGTVSVVAISSGLADSFPVGGRWPLGGKNVSTTVFETGRPARIDSYGDASGRVALAMRERALSSAVGAPVVVEGRVWGLIILGSRAEPLPGDSEARLASFTELVATAISNSDARTEVGRLAEEQAALRRVATLVARESPPAQVFAAVAEEVTWLLRSPETQVFRYEDDDTVTVVANSNALDAPFPVGERRRLDGDSVAQRVHRTGRAARVDDYAPLDGALAVAAHQRGIRSGAGAPILVDGKLWGVVVAASREQAWPAGTEERIGQFTELVATAISNVEARSELAASRARIVAATDDERRRVVRDLHDGGQQRLVHTIMTLKLAQHALQDHEEDLPALVAEALDHAEQATVELRELAHGILPSALSRGGLSAGVAALAARMPVPVESDVSVDRLPAAVEGTAYFVVAEALTNVAKHAHAGSATITARVQDGTLHLQVRDDGSGGARPDGSGLVGLADRLAALDGRLRVESPAGGGTRIAAEIPLPGGWRSGAL